MIELVIKIPREKYKAITEMYETFPKDMKEWGLEAIKNGTPLPKGHGRLVDISKIDEDRMESDNPIIYLTINGQYIEAISLDYLNDLQTIIEGSDTE